MFFFYSQPKLKGSGSGLWISMMADYFIPGEDSALTELRLTVLGPTLVLVPYREEL